MENKNLTFIVDCHVCKAKVAALQKADLKTKQYFDEDGMPYYRTHVMFGECPSCGCILVGESQQIAVDGYDGDEDRWSDIIRVYPEPPKTFSSKRIPKVVLDSISEAMKSLQANANIAACVMFGRALEAVCRDLLETPAPLAQPPQSPSALPDTTTTPISKSVKRPIMLGEGIRKLKDNGLIDQRLFDWSQQLQAFRNLAAHPTDISISRADADDLKSFVYAIIEYIYDLTDKYNEFMLRVERKRGR